MEKKTLWSLPHCHLGDMSLPHSFSSALARTLQIRQTAAIFQAMSMGLSVAASCEYQSPKHMPDTGYQHQIQAGMRTSNLGPDQKQYQNSSSSSNDNQGIQPTPSTIWGCPPPGLAALFWFAPSPMEGVRATSSISLMMDLRRATCISPNNLGSWNGQEQKCNMKNT